MLFAAARLTVDEHNAKTNVVNFSPGTIRVGVLLEGISLQPVVHITNMASALQPMYDETASKWNLHSVVQGKIFGPEVTYEASTKRAEVFSDMPRFTETLPDWLRLLIRIRVFTLSRPFRCPISFTAIIFLSGPLMR